VRHLASTCVLLVSSCSALVEIDDDKYLAGDGAGTGGDHLGGEAGDGDGSDGGTGDGDGGSGDGDAPNGGAPLGGSDPGGSGGGTGGDGTGGDGTGGDGTGGDGAGGDGTGGDGTGGVVIQIRDPDHYYPLNGNTDDDGLATPLSATTNGAVIWYPASGLKGGSLELPQNTDAYLSFEQTVGGTSPFTISWWFVSAYDGYITLASRFPNQQGTGSWELIADPASPRIKLGNQEIFFDADFPAANLGRWVHIALAYQENFSASQDRMKVWLNGEPVHEVSEVFAQSAITADANIKIGQGGNGTQRFGGLLDEIRFYNAYLTDAEVEALYLFDAPPN
jgi:hypothetical protein